MRTRLHPSTGPLRGAVRVPGDKSICHRALLLGAIAQGDTHVRGFSQGADNLATIDALRRMGVQLEVDGAAVTIHGTQLRAPGTPLDCRNSGTTMRLLAGLLSGLGVAAVLTGDHSLSKRPMERVAGPLRAQGLDVQTSHGTAPVHIRAGGTFRGDQVDLKMASAQVKSAMLLAALGRGVSLRVTEPHPSRDHTEHMLRAMGVGIVSSAHYTNPDGHDGRAQVLLPAHGVPLAPLDIQLPGDISSAAFLMAAAAIVPGSIVDLPQVGVGATRTGVLEALSTARVPVQISQRVTVHGEAIADIQVRAGAAQGMDVPPSMVPRLVDEIPVLAVVAACLPGISSFCGVGELRVKESDRLERTAALLRACGRHIEIRGDNLFVHGQAAPLRHFSFDAEDDHRMAAAAAVASLAADGPCAIDGIDVLGVSYPNLLQDLESLKQ